MATVVKTLLFLIDDIYAKTYADSTVVLNAIRQFEFVLGLMILKAILSNSSALSRFLQEENVDVINAKRNADLTIKTLREFRDEDDFKRLRIRTSIFSDR